MYQKTKKYIFNILEASSPQNIFSRLFDSFIMILIIFNVLFIILETVQSISASYDYYFKIFETVSVIIFTVEYLVRLWSCNADERYKGLIKGRLRFALQPIILVDLIAILPFYLPMFMTFDLVILRALRLVRLFRLFKMERYVKSLKIIRRVTKSKKEELLVAIFVVLILLVITSSMMYFIEHKAQPEAFANIPAAMWWGASTLTTVGYGDVYPITILGKVLGAAIALLGMGLFALPAGILASGLIETINIAKSKPKDICPHCGKYIIRDDEKIKIKNGVIDI